MGFTDFLRFNFHLGRNFHVYELSLCFISQVGLPHDADDLHDRHVLPARNSHRTWLEHINVPSTGGARKTFGVSSGVWMRVCSSWMDP